jgi:hypothetical protein
MSDLNAMQQAVYHAAGKYHSMLGEYFTDLHPDHQSPRLKEKADQWCPFGESNILNFHKSQVV